MQKSLLVAAFIAALICSVADILLLYVPKGGYETGDYAFLNDIPTWRLMWGTYLGVFLLPFHVPGIYVVTDLLKAKKPIAANWGFRLGCLIMIWGVVYHGSTGIVATAIRQGADIKTLTAFFEPVGFVLFSLFSILCVLFAIQVWKGYTLLPKYLVWLNPLFFYILFVVAYLLSPAIGGLFIVAGFNLSLGILYGGLILFRTEKE